MKYLAGFATASVIFTGFGFFGWNLLNLNFDQRLLTENNKIKTAVITEETQKRELALSQLGEDLNALHVEEIEKLHSLHRKQITEVVDSTNKVNKLKTANKIASLTDKFTLRIKKVSDSTHRMGYIIGQQVEFNRQVNIQDAKDKSCALAVKDSMEVAVTKWEKTHNCSLFASNDKSVQLGNLPPINIPSGTSLFISFCGLLFGYLFGLKWSEQRKRAKYKI